MRAPVSVTKMALVTTFSFVAITRQDEIEYADCSAPRDVKSYAIGEACEQLTPPPPVTEQWQLFQSPTVKRVTGTKCTIQKSTFFYTCGSWGHLKTATVPEILHVLPVSAEWCRSLAHTRQFVPPGSSETFTLRPDSVNVVKVETTGKILRQDQAVSCQGEPGRIEGSIMPSILILTEYHISISPEHYLIHEGQIESLSDHLRLPSNCAATQTYCETAGGTYIWTMPSSRCNLELISQFQPRQEGSLLIDEHSKVLVNLTQPAVMPACGPREFHHTEFSHVVALRGGDPIPGVKKVDPNDVRTDIFVSAVSAYTTYRLENKIAQIAASWRHQVCKQRWSQRSNEPQRLAPDLWGMRRGDILHTFRCVIKAAEISEEENCFHDIPIKSDPPVFVDPVSRIAKAHSATVPCSKRMPMMVRTKTQWVEISPHLRRATPPSSTFPDDEPGVEHEDVSHTGVYTAAELEDWSAITSFPSYETALVNEIALGSCSVTGKCSYRTSTANSGIPAYDLRRMLQKSIKSLDLWEKLNQWILAHGAYLAALVLILTAVSWALNLTLMAMALIREGPAQALAVASVLCCSGPQNYGRIQRRRIRQQQRETDERLLYPLQPANAPKIEA